MERMKYGYARVSTDDQTPALQLAALKKAGWKTIFKDDGLSGATMKRPALQRCLKKLEPSDMLMVWELDRLGRSQALAPANRATRLALAQPLPPFNFFDGSMPVYTHYEYLPASKLNKCRVDNVVVADGAIMTRSEEH